MARRLRLSWSGLSALAGAGSLALSRAPAALFDWQPGLALTEPWRWWTAALVHWSEMHLAANLGGCVLVAAYGRAAGCGPRAVLAWFIAWPLTQLGLLLRPDLQRFGGLSGVLHAGVAAASVDLILREHGQARWIAAMVLAGIAAKVLFEAPWGPPLVRVAGWDIAIAPLAHATGMAAGIAAAWLAWKLDALRRPAVPDRSDRSH